MRAIGEEEKRQQADEAVEKERDRAQQYLDISGVMIIVINKDKRVSLVNQKGCQVLGYSEKEILGKNWFRNFLPERMRGEVEAGFDRLIAGEVELMEYYENPVVTRSREERTIAWHNTVIRDADGRVVATLSSGEDITKRKKAEEALKNSEKFLDSVIENTPNAIWVSDEKGTIIRMNRALRDLLKIKDEEIIGKYNVLNDAQVIEQGFLPLIKSVFEKGETVSFTLNYDTAKEKQVELAETTQRVLELVISAVKNEDGKVIHAICQEKDITERRRAEDALRESEAFQSELLANSPIPISVINPDSSVRYVNPALVKLTGFSADELTGEKAPYSYWAEESLTQTMKGFKRAMRQGSDRVVELFKRKNGERFWVEITTTPVKKDGKFQYLLAGWVDITERKRAEETLRESEARYRAVIEGAHDMIQSISLDGRIIFVNKSWRDTLGYTEAELSSLNLFDIIHPDSLAHCRGLFAEVMSGKSVHGIEAAFLTKDGRKILVEGNAAPRYIGKKVVASQGIFRDVTESKQAEEKLRDEATRRRILIDQSSDGIVILDEKGKIYEANQRFAEMLGYTPEEARELHVWDFEAQLNREQILEKLRTMDESGDHFETRHRRKDGTVFDVEISSNGAVYAGQKLVFSVCRDITARKKAEAALAGEAIRHRILIDESSDGIVILDEKGGVYEANRRFAEMLGYTPEEVRELHLWDWDAHFKREQLDEMVASVGPEGDHFETQHRRKDGTIFDVEISTNGAVYAGQKLIFCVCRDVTARKRAEAALKESEEKYKTLVEATSDIIWEAD